MKVLTLVVCLAIFIAGCGSAGARSTANNVTMQGGQWEYVVMPENGGITMYFGTNVPTTSATFDASNVVIFQPSQITLTQNLAPISCSGYSINGTIGGTKIDGQFSTPTAAFASFSGQLNSNGQSISDGKYSGQTCGNPSNVHGTLTGYTVAPLNGTFTGTLTSNPYGSDIMTVTFAQNPDFSVNVLGTFVENGVTTTFVNMPAAASSLIVGASLFFGANTVTVNGNSQFSAQGHLNPAGTELTIELNGPSEAAIGTLTKQ